MDDNQIKKIEIIPQKRHELTPQGKKYTSIVMVNVRECGLDYMFHRHLISEFQHKAGIRFRQIFEGSAIGGMKGRDYSQYVDSASTDKTQKDSEESSVNELLKTISISIAAVNKIFKRMPERCDPYVYYHRVRPFIFGSKDNPDLKNGVIYEGQYDNKSQFFRGETGAQSSIMPTLDGALGVEHSEDSLRHYLNEMREYMPVDHRKFIEEVESKSMVKDIIKDSITLTDAYNQCLEEIRAFRELHLHYARTYIHNQSKQKNPFGAGGSTIRGTGGTPFMKYLKKHRDETEQQKH